MCQGFVLQSNATGRPFRILPSAAIHPVMGVAMEHDERLWDGAGPALALLLTTRLERADDQARPLSPAEWARLRTTAEAAGIGPHLLLGGDPGGLLVDRTPDPWRVAALLARKGKAAEALRAWASAGIWLMSELDDDYPDAWRARLRNQAPPLLFARGDRALVAMQGVAVVGSRAATADEVAYAGRLGAAIAASGLAVISGCARGIDQAAMLGALEAGGCAIGLLPLGLAQPLPSGLQPEAGNPRLLLLSAVPPHSPFDRSGALARNVLIHSLGAMAVAVQCGQSIGGTWHGAVRNLRHGWTPLWVRPSDRADSGVPALCALGARAIEGEQFDIEAMLSAAPHRSRQLDLFAAMEASSSPP